MDGAEQMQPLEGQGLSREVREFLERVGQERSVRAGEILFRSGEEGRSLFLVQEGSIHVYRTLEEDRREILGWIQEGEILGELEFLVGGARSMTAEAMEDCLVLEIPDEVLPRAEVDLPIIAFELVNAVAKRLAERLRLINDLHKREILRGIESSGAQILDLHYILRDTFRVEISLTGGERFAGSIVLLTRSFGGYQITILDQEGDLVCVPYDSISSIRAHG